MRCSRWRSLWLVCLGAAAGSVGHAASVLMISVDGMKPQYALQADARQLRLPYLTGMVAHGVHASGVIGVWPTITYPSHTTLITGVTPAEHGILANLEFDPRRNFDDSWYWYSPQIRVPTLWQAAHTHGLRTASVGWPVSVGTPDVDFLIPEYWRVFHAAADSNPSDRHLIAALSRPDGMLETLQKTQGPYLMGNDIGIEADEIKTRFAAEILRTHKPHFMTVHLSSLDEAEHAHGPFSPAATEAIEAIDGMLQRLDAAAHSADPATRVLVVSDHGFVALTHRVNLFIPFVEAGLLELDAGAGPPVAVKSWRAQPWLAGGMAAIMLKDPHDAATLAEVRALLDTLERDPRNGIADVLDPAAMSQRGAFPGASWLVVMQPGYALGNATRGDVVSPLLGAGSHGFSPDDPSMQASFFIAGPGIAHGRDLGVVDMRQIAPTVAQLLGVPLPSATAAPLAIRQ